VRGHGTRPHNTANANKGLSFDCKFFLLASRKIPRQVIPHKANNVRYRCGIFLMLAPPVFEEILNQVQNDGLEFGIFRDAGGSSLQPLIDVASVKSS